MKNILQFTKALLVLALICSCGRVPEASVMMPAEAEAPLETVVVQAPEVEPPSIGTFPRSDLVATSMTIMQGDGITYEYQDYTPMILVQQGATMIVSALVFIDNTLTGGEDSFDRDTVEVRFRARLINQPDVPNPNEETIYVEEIEYDDYQPDLSMDPTGVYSGLRETGLLNADKFLFPDNFDAVESPTDYVIAENELTSLMAVDPEMAENILLEQQPRLRYFNAGGIQGVNNHPMPIQQYAVNYTLEPEDYERFFPWIVFTFEMGTGALQTGNWEISVQVDHNNEILEVDEWNNDLEGFFTLHPQTTDWAPAYDAWWEAQWETEVCDPWGDDPAPTKFDTKVIRVRHPTGGVPAYEDTPDYLYWSIQGMANVLRTQMYVTEFWGPHGSGRQYIDGNWVEYYDDMGGQYKRPAPEEIENVFLFLSGNGGCRSGRTSIATGQDNYYCNFTGVQTWDRYQLRIESWPGQLIYKQPNYDNAYKPSNSLMVMAFQHVGTAGYSSNVQLQNAAGFVNYLIDRTEGFKNVRNVWLGGNSRGGAVAVHMARIIKRRMIEGDPYMQASADMRIIVTGADAVTLHGRDDLYFNSHKYICRGTCYDANTHELDRAFPFNSDPDRDYTNNLFIFQSVGSSGALDSMVQYYHDNYSNWRNWVITEGLPGNFYTQNMEGFANATSHSDMCRTWKQITAINHIQFFFSKALDKGNTIWDSNFVPYPDGCK